MKVDKQILLDLELPEMAISNVIVDTRRWLSTNQIIFEMNSKFYQTNYDAPLTENSGDETPWEYLDEVDITEVHKVEKLIEVWEVKK